jgi:PEP-CTERM motif-containing protein
MRIWILSMMMASAAPAATISSFSPATDLIGGTVTATRFGGVMSSATFVAVLGGSVIASSPGSAGFDLTVTAGDTFGATWTLTNTDASAIMFNRITALSIDLTLSAGHALFDNDSLPSTPGSFSGVLGVTPLAGVAIVSSGEVNPWTDPLNTGDMFTAVNITFGGGFTALASSSWADDTDSASVPEPASVILMGAGLLFILSRLRVAR